MSLFQTGITLALRGVQRLKKKRILKGKVSTSWIVERNFVRSLKFQVISHNNQLAEFLWLSSLRVFCFIDQIKITEKFILKASKSYFGILCRIFIWRSYFTLNKIKTHFSFRRPISRESNNREKQKKKRIKADRCNFRVQPLEFINTHLHKIIFQVFDLVKNAKKRRV